MNKFRLSLLSLSVFMVFVACGGIDGNLSVTQNMTLNDRKGHSHQINPGNYAINLNFKENKNRLIIAFDNLNGQKETIEANTPSGFSIPAENGSFSLKAQDYGQNVDLAGTATTTRKQSEERYGQDSCTFIDWQTVCYTAPNGQYTCYQEQVNRSGWHDVRYYIVTTEKKIEAQFTKAGTENSVASLLAKASSSQQINTWEGFCHP